MDRIVAQRHATGLVFGCGQYLSKQLSTPTLPPRKYRVAHCVADLVRVSLVSLYRSMSTSVLQPPHAPQCITWASSRETRVSKLSKVATDCLLEEEVIAAHTSVDAYSHDVLLACARFLISTSAPVMGKTQCESVGEKVQVRRAISVVTCGLLFVRLNSE